MEYQKIKNVTKNLQQNNSQKATNENDKEIPKERYISPKERQKIIDNLIPIIIVIGISKTNEIFRKYTGPTN